MRPPRIRSLRAIALAFTGAISLATVVTGVTVYTALLATIDRTLDKRLRGEAAELLADRPDEAELVRRIAAESRRRDSADIGFLLRARDGRQITGNIRPDLVLPLGASSLDHDNGIAGLTRGRALTQQLASGATLILVAESEPVDNHDSHRLLILSLGFGTILLLVIGGTLALSLTIRRNIEDVRMAAEAIVDGDMRARVPEDGSGTAFDRQARAFNRMLDRIGELMTSLSGISHDIAHDLRTPLSRLHGRLSALADQPGAAPELDAAVAESEDILAMFAAILRIAEVEGGDRRAMFETLDLTALVEDVAASLDAMVEDGGRTLSVGPLAAVQVVGDQRLLVQMLVNLVENAVNHTPQGTRIGVALALRDDHALLLVSDDGPGIPADQRVLALRRFGRLDKSRGDAGHGLGLPLVAAIAHLHRGRIALGDAGPGLAVSIRLPLAG